MDQVGRYQILEELGRGSHGIVYKALDPAIGRTIAIKAISLGDINSGERERVRDGIWNEARLAGTLSHPNIVAVYDVVDTEDAVYIVMELVDGESLESAIESVKDHHPDRLTRTAFFSVLKQIAEALDYAHRRGVIHRDVKPANIGLTNYRSVEDGELIAKIADFGVAKFTSSEITQQLGGTPRLVGTPNYMSPEQVAGASVGRASDQFSLAVIAYEVLTGRKAFAGDALETLLYRIRYERAEPVHELNASLSPTVDKVMLRALAKNPDERFGSCGEFAGALEFALGDSPRWAPGVLGIPADSPSEHIVPNFVLAKQSDFERREAGAEAGGRGRTLLLLATLGLAVGLAAVLIVRMNSGPSISSQILDSKSSPPMAMTPAPQSPDELKEDGRTIAPPLDLAPTRVPDNPPSVVKVPTPVAERPVVIPPKTGTIQARQVKQIATSGEVQMLTDPPGANLIIDSITPCTSPCSVTLAGGRHTLAATLSGFGVSRKIFYVPQDPSVFLPMVKSIGVLLVNSDPVGAVVNLDGQATGRTPMTLRLSPGTHRVSVSDGSRVQDESVQIVGDEVRTRLFKF